MKYTIFTATRNRAKTLTRLYNSLTGQTFKNFEWIIIDDGSDDNTKNIIEIFKKEAKFPIIYIYQKNSGKHVALNNGVKLAKGEFFVNIDSDDFIKPFFLEKLLDYWNSVPEKEKDNFTGVMTSSCMMENGNEVTVGQNWPEKVIISNYLDIANKLGVKGDKHGFIKTELMKKYPFPEYEGENFMTETSIMYQIAMSYKTLFVDEKMIVIEYRNDGLSRNIRKIFIKNPNGSMHYRYTVLTLNYKFPLMQVLIDQAQFLESAFFAKKNPFKLAKISRINHKWLFLLSLPLSFIFGLYDLAFSSKA